MGFVSAPPPFSFRQEAATVRVRIDEAHIEKLLAEHNPFAAAS